MAFADSLDKIIKTYLAAVTTMPFTYKGETYNPKPLRISPQLLRGFTCPPQCGGCCKGYTLDYLPHEMVDFPDLYLSMLEPRSVIINDLEHTVWSYTKSEVTRYCNFLDTRNGRCSIYMQRAFSCDFELIRFLTSDDDNQRTNLTQKLYGRGWSYQRIDGQIGAMCEMTDIDKESINEVVRKLIRLQGWAIYFGITTSLDEIIAWVRNGPHNEPLMVHNRPIHLRLVP